MAHENPLISSITLPSGTTYDLHDKELDEIKSGLTGAMHYVGVTTTALTDGATTSPITIDSADYTPKAGDVVIYNNKEFVCTTTDAGVKWNEFGSTGSLKALAFKDSASGSYTPAGTVSAPTFTGTEATIAITSTPAGTVSAPDFTGTEGSVSVSGTATGTISKPTFSGTAGAVSTSVDYTPEGTVASTFTGTKATISMSKAYTPAGTVAAPTISVTPTTGSASDTSFTVANEVLTIGNTTGSFMTGATATATAPAFTGTEATIAMSSDYTPAGSVAGTFTGTEATIEGSGSFTPAGTVSQPTFTGTAFTSTGAFTPAGTVSAPTFTGTENTASAAYTPAGTVSQPTFTGTGATITVQ